MLSVLITLIVAGLVLYLLQLLPIDATIKRAIQAIAIVILVIWLLRMLWPLAGLGR
ncbi:MAG TPA: Thivi_2564 family membrane protein [Pseudolabrys sp.]|nr:Thivi_2564 family membrane protein [Pseudolabrys sp.]